MKGTTTKQQEADTIETGDVTPIMMTTEIITTIEGAEAGLEAEEGEKSLAEKMIGTATRIIEIEVAVAHHTTEHHQIGQ